MLKTISTIRIGPWEKLEIDLAPHLNVFTGDNGFGKTYLLDLIWLLYSRHWKQAPANPRTLAESEPDGTQTAPLVGNFTIEQFDYTVAAHYNESAEQWQIQDNIQNRASSRRSPRADLVIYFGSEGSCLVWDSYRNIFPDEENWWSSHNDRERRYAFQLSPNELLNGLPYSNGQGMWCNGLLTDWVLWQLRAENSNSSVAQTQPFQVFEKILATISPPDEPLKPGRSKRLYQSDSREHPTIDTIYGNVPLVHCSSGIKRIVTLAYAITWAYYEHQSSAIFLNAKESLKNMTIILDEVELHLHPKWQRVVLPSILQIPSILSSELEVQLFATTHSPLVLASIEPIFDSMQDKLFLFKDEAWTADSNSRTIHIEELIWAKFGNASNWLSSNAFGLSDSRSIDAEHAIQYAYNYVKGETSKNPEQYQSRESIHAYLTKSVASRDPFWARWLGRTRNDEI